MTNSIKVNIKLDKNPVYIDENTVEIYYTLGNTRTTKPIVAKFDGQVWQTVSNK